MLDYNEELYNANNSGQRYVIHQGGTGSGKTYSIMQYLVDYCFHHENAVVSVVSKTLPHLQRGAMRDLKRILADNGWSANVKVTKTDFCYRFGTSVIEFFPADDEAKLRGARRDILFINECNTVDYESFTQLDVRTRKYTLLDFNPVRRFWVHDELIPSLNDADYLFVKSTYKNNPFLTEAEKSNIERRRHNANWWKVYGEGEIGSAEGQVFTNWEIVQPQPSLFKANLTDAELKTYLPGSILGYGVDFGYSHSPTAIVQVNEFNGELYAHEWFYKTGVQNDRLISFVIKNIDVRKPAVADSASPQNIDYLRRNGWYWLSPASKGADSVEFGINLLLERKINVTSVSLNLIKELQQYMWETDENGKSTGRPVKESDHAIDAIRYLITYLPLKRVNSS